MTILSGQSRLFHEYSKRLLLATAPLQENQDVLPLKNFDGLELVSYNNNERNNGVSSLYVDCTKTNVVGDYYNARELRIPFSVPYSGNADNLHVDVRSIGLDYDLQVNPVLEFSRVDNDFLYLILQRRVISENGQGLECNPLPFKGPPYNFGFSVKVFEKNCVSENTCINPDYLTELNSNVQCEQLLKIFRLLLYFKIFIKSFFLTLCFLHLSDPFLPRFLKILLRENLFLLLFFFDFEES